MDNLKIDTKKVKTICEELLKRIDPDAQVNQVVIKESTVVVDAKVTDPQLFIGQGAETLMAVQHLLRVILRKTIKPQKTDAEGRDSYYVDLDINGYKKKKREYLKELAMSTANEVSLTGKEKFLNPMVAYERRVVHMELSERLDIITESRGREPERRVIIKPRPK